MADGVRDRSDLLDLNLESMTWNCVEIEKVFETKVAGVLGMPLHDYAASIIDKIAELRHQMERST